ncbi:hypothetical protein GCM10028785_03790 [Hydrogenophaga soli]
MSALDVGGAGKGVCVVVMVDSLIRWKNKGNGQCQGRWNGCLFADAQTPDTRASKVTLPRPDVHGDIPFLH